MAEAKLCAVEGCGKPAFTRGWCTTHYPRWLKYGDPLKGGWKKKLVCDELDCSNRPHARGLCLTHYRNSDFRPSCAIDGCDRKAVAKGLCNAHRRREQRHGSPNTVKRVANGEYRQWLERHVDHPGPDCLIWPYWRSKQGYGPSRIMCALAHGDPPTPNHEAAHSCGNGDLGCVHPAHLYWATHSENQAEMADHGKSQRGEVNFNSKLTQEQVVAIRGLEGSVSQRSIARLYGIHQSTVSGIWRRRRWKWLE